MNYDVKVLTKLMSSILPPLQKIWNLASVTTAIDLVMHRAAFFCFTLSYSDLLNFDLAKKNRH